MLLAVLYTHAGSVAGNPQEWYVHGSLVLFAGGVDGHDAELGIHLLTSVVAATCGRPADKHMLPSVVDR